MVLSDHGADVIRVDRPGADTFPIPAGVPIPCSGATQNFAEPQRIPEIGRLAIEPLEPINLPRTEPIGPCVFHPSAVPLAVPPAQLQVIVGALDLIPAIIPESLE
jgi:hypothetical protein